MAEKTLNEISRDARVLFAKGSEALQRDNFDYAITLLNQVLEHEPLFFEGRKALRAAQFKKAGAGSTGFFKKMMSGAGSSPLVAKAQMTLRSNPAGAMAVAEQILNTDPTSSSAHRIIVEAAKQLELPRTAVLSYETLAKNSPKDKKLIVEYANALSDIGENSRAENLLIELLRETPNDGDLSQALKNISARTTLDEGGYNALASGEGSYRDILKDKTEAESLEQEKKVVKTEDNTQRLINEYEARLPNEPENFKLVRSLAELYTQKKQFERALEYYDRIKKSGMGNDPSLDTAIANTIVRRFDHQISEVNPFDADHAERVAQFDEAIAEFQKAQNNPHKRVAAMSYLAQCFAQKKMFDSAVRKFQEALKEKTVFDEEKKDLIYNLGCVLENSGKKTEAFEQFLLIWETDAGYKDVAAKVDAYQAGQ